MTEILNDITTQYQMATVSWYSALAPIVNHVFATLAIIEIAWSGIEWVLAKQELSSLWTEILKRIVFIGFFYAVLLHGSSWIPAIIKSFMMLGAHASHIEKLDPSSIFNQGLSIASSVLVPLEKQSLLTSLLPLLIGGITALCVSVSFALIAGELVITLIESYLVVGAGILFLGLGSSRWTHTYTTQFLHYSVSVGCKLFFLYLLIGVGANMALHWGLMIEQNGMSNMRPFLEVLGGSLVFVYITHSVPPRAASLLSGVPSSTVAGVTSTASLIYQMAKKMPMPGSMKAKNTIKNIINAPHKDK